MLGTDPSGRGCGLTRILLACAVLILAPWVAAQGIASLHHQAWSTEQGLPQDSVHAILQDRTGFIWVATEAGIARFDGVSFSVFSHANQPAFTSDDACCLAQDANSDLWVGTADGLIRIHDQIFQRFSELEGLPSSSIRSLLTDSRGLLVLTAEGLARWKGDRFEAVSQAPRETESIARGNDGQVWLLANGRVSLLKDGLISSWSTGVNNGPLKGLTAAPEGAIWTFTNTEVARTGTAAARRWQTGKHLPGRRVQSLFVDRDGSAWVGTDDGVAVIGKDASDPVGVPLLRGNSILQTFEDREGTYWIGTESTGLHVLRALAFRTQPATANKAVTAILEGSPGITWVGTRSDGLLRFKDGQNGTPVRAEALTSRLILSLANGTKGSVWAGTPDGINQVDAHGRVRRWTSADGLPDDYIQALASGRDGCVWAGTRRGLAHLCGSNIAIQTKADGLAGDLIGALLLARNGELWIGTSGGLSRIGLDGKITTHGQLQGIVSAMAEDAGGRIWIATRNTGLSRITSHSARQVNSSPFKADILGMAADGQGYLWLRRERGVDRVSLADLDRCAESGAACLPGVSHYESADGLPTGEMTAIGSSGIAMMAGGELWIATRRGAGIANSGHLPHNPVPPGVVVESFLVDGVPLATSTGSLAIPFGGLRFTMEYAGLSFIVPSEVRYRFKLDGYDKGWNEAGTRRSATYTNLPPRSYTFRVQAMNNDGVWNEAGAAFSFRIIPPFYRRLWFTVVLALCIAAAAAGLYKLRLRHLQTRFNAVLKERNRIAREIHDTLAQDFVGVTLQLDLIAQMLGMRKIEAAVQQITQARKLVTEGLAEARQSIWELRANTGTDSLPTRLAKVGERYTSENLTVRTQVGGAFRPLDRRMESEVLRVAQEALSNVQRHAQAFNASVELRYGRDELVLTIEDDGRGFIVDEALRSHERYGLSGLKERAGLLGGSLEIASEPGKGTRITLTTEAVRRKDAAT